MASQQLPRWATKATGSGDSGVASPAPRVFVDGNVRLVRAVDPYRSSDSDASEAAPAGCLASFWRGEAGALGVCRADSARAVLPILC